MRYRTLIELVCEGENENDAAEVAGEFLRGNIESGVKISCRTKPFKSQRFLQASAVFAAVTLSVIGVASFAYFKSNVAPFSAKKNTNAIQPPLKTSQSADFHKTRQEKENKN